MNKLFALAAALPLVCLACAGPERNPAAPSTSADLAGTAASADAATPPFNLQAVLRPVDDGSGFGLVEFRQPKDGLKIVYLDVWVRDLAPATEYVLQRAVDFTIDGDCTSQGWLTLGKGLVAQSIVTDGTGTGREELFRDLAAFATGSRFDIHFRVVQTANDAAVLQSGCYEFVITE